QRGPDLWLSRRRNAFTFGHPGKSVDDIGLGTSAPTIDLLVSTIGRTSDLGRLLDSLEAQTYRSFRVVVVDQNDDDRIESVVAPHERTLSILRLRSRPGL